MSTQKVQQDPEGTIPSKAHRLRDLDEGHKGRYGGVRGFAVGSVFVQGQVAHDARRIVLRLLQVIDPATAPPAGPLLRCARDG